MNLFQKLFSSPTAMLKLSIALCYMALAVYMLLRPDVLYFLNRTYTKMLAILFLVYGAFRLFRAVNDLKDDE